MMILCLSVIFCIWSPPSQVWWPGRGPKHLRPTCRCYRTPSHPDFSDARRLGECGEAWNPPFHKPRIWNKEGSIRPLHWKLLTFRLNLRWDKDLSPSISNFRTQDSIQILNLACYVCNRLQSMAQMMHSSSSKAAKLSCRSLPFEPRWRWKSTCDEQPNKHSQPRCLKLENCTAGRLGSANTQTETRLQNVQLFEQRHDAAPRKSCEYSCVHLPYSGDMLFVIYCQHSAAVYGRFQANIKLPETPQKSYLIDPISIWLLSSGTNQVTWQTRVKRHKICHGNRSGTKSRACLPATARIVGSWKCVMKNLPQLGSSKHIWSETDFTTLKLHGLAYFPALSFRMLVVYWTILLFVF